eukprot:2975077-Rhodomonas_salina.1
MKIPLVSPSRWEGRAADLELRLAWQLCEVDAHHGIAIADDGSERIESEEDAAEPDRCCAHARLVLQRARPQASPEQ